MINIRLLSKSYKNFELYIEQLTIPRSQLMVMRGENGSGKTTLLELMLDLVERDIGEITINGFEVKSSNLWTSKTTAFLGNHFTVGYLKPLEYLHFVAYLRNSQPFLEEEFNQNFAETKLINSKSKISQLSNGQKSKIGILAAFIGNPQLVLLDEPLAHLDSKTKLNFNTFLSEYITKNEATVIISDHDNNFDVSCKVDEIIMEKGKIKNCHTNLA